MRSGHHHFAHYAATGAAAVVVAVGLVAGAGAITSQPVVAPSPSTAAGDSAEGGFILPDPHITPGAVRSTDTAQVCVRGYTSTVRVGLTPAEKQQVDAAYHWTYAPGAQEYDHLIPLELGGDNGVTNIWPQPIAEAHVKDRLENELHAKLCSHQMTIQNAQSCIRVDWVSCWRKEGQP